MPDTDSQLSGQSQMDTEPTKRREEVSITLQTFLLSLHSWVLQTTSSYNLFPTARITLCKISWKGAKAVREASWGGKLKKTTLFFFCSPLKKGSRRCPGDLEKNRLRFPVPPFLSGCVCSLLTLNVPIKE